MSGQFASPPPLSMAVRQTLDRARGLSQAGRLAEADAAYRSVLAQEPTAVQAAVGLARLMTRMGQAQAAESLLDGFLTGPAPWPDALSARAAARKAQGRKAAALADYALAARLNPTSGVAAHNVASGLGDAGRDREAVAECERAFALGLDAPETWLVYGRALQGLSQFEASEQAFRKAIERRPAYAEAVRDLCQLLWMRSGDADHALAPIATALAAAPAEARAALAGVKIRLLNHIRGEAAALAFAETALPQAPDDPRLALETAALLLAQDPGRSRSLCAAVLARRPGEAAARRALAHACLALGESREAAEIAETLLAERPFDQEAAAALATAWRLAGDARYRQLWDYEALVGVYSLDTPRGWTTLGAYLDELRGALGALHRLCAHPIEQSLRGGAQTPQNLRASEDPVIAAFFQAIEGPLAAYRLAVGQGSDLFRARNQGDCHVVGAWSVRLAPGGFHVDHIHPQGWISSACYIEVPTAVGDGQDRAGWLRFGAPPIPTRPRLEAEYYVRPEPGRLALFPSYMWHGTVPFGGDQPRMTIAFDVAPD
ncbi:putative 2OG-Fe(II) oxygenase [Phenylobacterium sp.]|uniref:putative 2OG-Fe(II) oxygenase n=1 Tax=Phenylobacterium sp. TaxID=1871053 RepID=UPI0027314501|nr:putative 2OG-Fe(II) oxygenase [Phenylobacterium sp.]MDP2213605.1 putative 2OG-Fe(II) oxygenase [Phenylobacterium sp.]